MHSALIHIPYMHEALIEARTAEQCGEVPIGAVIVHKERIIARAHNTTITDNDPTAHAEINALRIAARACNNYRLNDTTLYVTIEPCPMCIGACVWARVDTIVFGARDTKVGSCGTVFPLTTHPAMNHTIHVVPGILEQECKALIQQFFQTRRQHVGQGFSLATKTRVNCRRKT